MPLGIGIVGLPNVGKSTLFNALTRSHAAQAANYPFCTIDPNVGVVEVPDPRLARLAEMVSPEKVIPATVEFVDIAGLVRGASKGEGLGNQFLANIRECQAIAQVVRVFEDPNIIHVHDDVHPARDVGIVEVELILADLQTVDKRLAKAQSETKSGDKKKVVYAELLQRLKKALDSEVKAKDAGFSDEEKAELSDLHLLTMKEILYIANVHEERIKESSLEFLREKLQISAGPVEIIPISAKIEHELSLLSDAESADFLAELGIKESGLNALIHAAYRVLGLQTYFTAGPKEVRAWTYGRGWKTPAAAGVIHTDFEKGFIAAEVISYDDYVTCGGEQGAKEKGKMRIEGKEYVVQDGDVMHFRFNV
ncbi:MAG: redox-regulated ATPase YchF [Patescibacteria group bacterium]